EMALIDLHTTHILRLVHVLAAEYPTYSAVEIYSRMLGVLDSQRGTRYHSVLARRAAVHLPRPMPKDPAHVPLFGTESARSAPRAVCSSRAARVRRPTCASRAPRHRPSPAAPRSRAPASSRVAWTGSHPTRTGGRGRD